MANNDTTVYEFKCIIVNNDVCQTITIRVFHGEKNTVLVGISVL